MAVQSAGLFWESVRSQPELEAQETALRDAFCFEYVKDFDAYSAALRVGFQQQNAQQNAQALLSEGYVQRRIADLQRSAPTDEASQKQQDKALVLAVLRQAAQNGPYASRVQAAAKLANILGIDAPKDKEDADADLIEALRGFAEKVPS